MKNRRKFGIIVVIALCLGFFGALNNANAQVVEIGITGGLSSYYGDLNPIKPFNESRFGFGAIARYYQGSRWAFRFSYSNMNITASDEKVGITPEKKRSFKTDLNDFSLVAEFNFFDYWTGSRRNFITPYLFAGIGVVTFNPKTLDGIELCNILTDVDGYAGDKNKIEDGTAKYRKCAFSVPFGLGVKYSVNRRLSLSAEWCMHWAWTDWLDDCSGYYPLWGEGDTYAQYADPSGNVSLDGVSNEIKYIKRGDSVKYDYYSFLNVTVAFKFNLPQTKKCNAGSDRRYYKYY